MARLSESQAACDRGEHDTDRQDSRYEGTCIRCGKPAGYNQHILIKQAVQEAIERAQQAQAASNG